MKIQVLDDSGRVMLDFDPSASARTMLDAAASERTEIANVLHDAQAFLAQDHHVIASIKADISQAIGRIEHELGAHPAFTWAQTKLGNAAAHLEAYVAGVWEEPKQSLVPAGTAYDVRGVLVSTDGNG